MARRKPEVPAHDLDRIIIRLPPGMRDRIAHLAETNSRSMTAEVVSALEHHLERPDRLQKLEQAVQEILAGLTEQAEKVSEVDRNVSDVWRATESLEGFANEVMENVRGKSYKSKLYEKQWEPYVAGPGLPDPDLPKVPPRVTGKK